MGGVMGGAVTPSLHHCMNLSHTPITFTVVPNFNEAFKLMINSDFPFLLFFYLFSVCTFPLPSVCVCVC